MALEIWDPCKTKTLYIPLTQSNMSQFIRLALLLMVLLIITTCEAIDDFPPVHIKVTNQLSNGMVMNIHCFSKDHDIGSQAVPKFGWYAFYYQPILGSITVTCNIEWGGNSHSFDIYSYYRDRNICNIDCQWKVSEEGPCRWSGLISTYECVPWKWCEE